ncbi:ML domain-containing protein [Siphonobacter aquaeclarae]|uniref:Por secretion system C-terminal sorting domain-containing protein n=1 Tax=Siphonobacter aquaeclarae TaxID=563176 RepID=A0A1G9R8A6_9BACT|nr:hypothetical protein [Siphonobacter aquaeclarae]SDM19057.1 hypothetical protein SAMN04488090_2773 [Siphonobacter aquaeclarae]
MFRHLSSLILVMLGVACYGQSIQLSPLPANVCTNVPLTFTTSGSFGSDNVFKAVFEDVWSAQKTEVTPVQNNGVWSIQIPDALSATGDFYLTVSSTSPVVSIRQTINRISSVPTVSIVSVNPTHANPGQPVQLEFLARAGSGYATVVLNDGSQLQVQTGPKDLRSIQTLIAPNQSVVYSIASVANYCGNGTGSGSASLTIGDTPARVTGVFPGTLCRGSSFYISLSLPAGKTIADGTPFLVKLWLKNPDITPPAELSNSFDTDGIWENGRIKSTIPPNIPTQNSFYVQAMSSDGQVTAEVLPTPVKVSPAGQIQIETRTAEALPGQQFAITPTITGLAPFSITWSNGASTAGEPLNFPIGLIQTASFQVSGFQSGCEKSTIIPGTATYPVPPGIRIDTIPQNLFCPGDQIRLPISSNISPTAATEYWVDFYGELPNQGIQLRTSVKATNVGGRTLLLTAPSIVVYQGISDRRFFLKVRTLSPATDGYMRVNQFLFLNSLPRPLFLDWETVTVNAPRNVTLNYYDMGGGPSKITLTTGDVVPIECKACIAATAVQYIYKSGTVGVVSATNTCGTTTIPNPVLAGPPIGNGVVIDSVDQFPCPGATKVWFHTYGNITPGLTWSVYGTTKYASSDASAVFDTLLASGTTSPLSIQLPRSMQIRVSSGTVVSNIKRIYPTSPPSMSIDRSGSYVNDSPGIFQKDADAREAMSVLNGERLTLAVNPSTNFKPYRFTLTDGIKDYPQDADIRQYARLYPIPNQVSTFRVKEVSNACGQGTASGPPFTVTAMPFRIMAPELIASKVVNLCPGTTFSTVFVTQPMAPAGTQFAFEIAAKSDSVYHELGTTTSSPLAVRIPDNLAPGEYYFRIKDKNSPARTAILRALVQAKPVAALTLITPANGQLVYGQQARFRVTIAGTLPARLLFSNRVSKWYASADSVFVLKPAQNTSFGIESLVNTCGYGAANSLTSLIVKPNILVSNVKVTFACGGSTLGFTVDAGGNFGGITQADVKLLSSAGTSYAVSSCPLAAGTYFFPIPTGIPSGTYQLVLETPVVTSAPAELTLVQPGSPPVVAQAIGMHCENGVGVPNGTASAAFRLAGAGPFKMELKRSEEPESAYVYKGTVSESSVLMSLSVNTAYDVRVTDNCGLTAVSQFTTAPVPQLQPTPSTPPCLGQAYTLSLPGISGAYSWTKDGQELSTNNSLSFANYSGTNDGVYQYRASLAVSCVIRQGQVTLTGVTCDGPLPVTLAYFSAKAAECTAVLDWSTTSEENASAFVIERSVSATPALFGPVGQLSVRGSGSRYAFTQRDLSPDTYYYRLKMVDRDGTAVYSKTASVAVGCNGFKARPVSVYPNPTTSSPVVYLSLNAPVYRGTGSIRVVNTSGQQVAVRDILIDQENSVWAIQDLLKNTRGPLVIHVETAGGRSLGSVRIHAD